jgi:hypothetical protein
MEQNLFYLVQTFEIEKSSLIKNWAWFANQIRKPIFAPTL